MTVRYPLSPNGIFCSPQGEGAMLGVPMVFVRLAGCSIGCEHCDTDYSVAEREDAFGISRRVLDLLTENPGVEWIWVTGGEPTDHNLRPLLEALWRIPAPPILRFALATAGHKSVVDMAGSPRWDWVSVSPHDPAKWVQKCGSELKLVPGLNGFKLSDFGRQWSDFGSWSHRFVQPCEGKPETIQECLDWIMHNNGWRMGTQGHKHWGVV